MKILKEDKMRNRAIVLGDFEEVFEEYPTVVVYECAFCGGRFTQEEGIIEEYYARCPHCNELLK